MSKAQMPPSKDSSVTGSVTADEAIPVLSHRITTASSLDTSSSESRSIISSSGSSSSDTDSDGLGSELNQLPSFSDSSHLLPRLAPPSVPGLLAALRYDTGKRSDVDSEACFTDSDLSPHDSISADPSSRGPFDGESDDEQSDSDALHMEKPKKPKYEDRLTRLGYIERLPDIEGKRHYRLELSIDKSIEEDTIRTGLQTFKLSDSNLIIINRDGLQPQLAADLDNFNNEFLEVKKSPISGYGVFAFRDLDAYTPILVERELFNANSFDLYNKLDNLTKEQQKAFHRLHGHKRTPSEDIRAAIWHTNSFAVSMGCSLFLVASRFNHACKERNNVEYSYDFDKRCMAFVTKKRITEGSELFIRYSNDPKHLYAIWGFRCACGGCKGISEDACKAIGPFPWGEIETNDWN